MGILHKQIFQFICLSQFIWKVMKIELIVGAEVSTYGFLNSKKNNNFFYDLIDISSRIQPHVQTMFIYCAMFIVVVVVVGPVIRNCASGVH